MSTNHSAGLTSTTVIPDSTKQIVGKVNLKPQIARNWCSEMKCITEAAKHQPSHGEWTALRFGFARWTGWARGLPISPCGRPGSREADPTQRRRWTASLSRIRRGGRRLRWSTNGAVCAFVGEAAPACLTTSSRTLQRLVRRLWWRGGTVVHCRRRARCSDSVCDAWEMWDSAPVPVVCFNGWGEIGLGQEKNRWGRFWWKDKIGNSNIWKLEAATRAIFAAVLALRWNGLVDARKKKWTRSDPINVSFVSMGGTAAILPWFLVNIHPFIYMCFFLNIWVLKTDFIWQSCAYFSEHCVEPISKTKHGLGTKKHI